MHIPPPSPQGSLNFRPHPERFGLQPLPRKSLDFGVLWDSTCRAMLQSDHHTH